MVGIDKISFFTPYTYMDLVTLATYRGIDPDKFTLGIGQSKMSVPPLTQDTVSMAANAAYSIIEKEDLHNIDLIIVGTESGVDESKSVAAFVHQLLNIHPFARAIEMKQACYGASAGLMNAYDFVKQHPDKKALVIGSDISRYGLATSGEVTQGAGAIAMLVTSNPRILSLEPTTVAMTENIFDFWRPNYSDTAIVDGKFSNEAYLSFFNTLWSEFKNRTKLSLTDFSAFCFHMPYTKMGKKALATIIDETNKEHQEALNHRYQLSTAYTRDIGNIYTGSLYLSLMSLLETSHHGLVAGDRIGLFSYGSGAVGELFSGILVDGFEQHLLTSYHQRQLDERTSLSIEAYEEMFEQTLPQSDGLHILGEQPDEHSTFYLKEIKDHQRHYGKREG